MGWIKTLPSGRYQASYRDPSETTAKGAPVTQSKVFRLKKDAKAWLAKQTTSIDENTHVSPRLAKKRLGEFWGEFLAGSDLRASTLDLYERHYRLYIAPTFAHRPLGSITASQVRAWRSELQSKGTGAATVKAVTTLLKTILNRAVNDDILARSPARNIENPSTDPRGGLRVLEAEQVAALAEAHPERFRALVYLLAYRGLRIGEAAALRVGDLDLMRGSLRIAATLSEVGGLLHIGPTKTGEVRSVSLPPFLRDMLAAHVAAFSDPKDPEAFVFTMPEGGPLRCNNYRKRMFGKALERAIARGVAEALQTGEPFAAAAISPDLTPHDLRDTAATLAFAAGASVKEVADLLGHANPSITLRRYTGVLDSMRERTDAALDETFRACIPEGPEQSAAYLRHEGGSQVLSLDQARR